ncbi:D-amino-acid oxidase [Primulina eburnea]|uniref:D-amino-acid oxidase n=1 Tax=Primulina eburnea TaxID=1245227 RepID=UPI003C6C2D77
MSICPLLHYNTISVCVCVLYSYNKYKIKMITITTSELRFTFQRHPTRIRKPVFHPIKLAIRCSSSAPPSMDDQIAPKKVVVCGGGVIGVCTAYFLSKMGAAVTLVEKSSIACAASGKAGGFLALDWCDGGSVGSLARASFNLHRSLAQELNGAELYGYRPVTTLSLSVTESTSSSEKSNRKPGRDVPSWVDGPAKGPRTIGTVETTAQVHPQLFTKTLVSKAVEEYGMKVVIKKLEAVSTSEGEVKAVVLEDGGEIEADAVVLALGPWTGKFSLLSTLFRVYGLKAHSIILEPKNPDDITPHALFLSYYPAQGGKPMDPEVYPRPTGEVYICGMSAEAEVPDDPEQVTAVPESIRVLKTVASSVSSHLVEGEAVVKAEQACFLPCTDDSVPVIGEVPGVKGCYVTTGHSCWGILNGPATGAAVAELVLDGRATIVDIQQFSPARFLRGKR